MQRNGIHTFLSAPSCSVSLTTSFQSHLFSWPPWTRHFLFSRHHSASSWGVTSLLRSQNPSHGKGAEHLRHIQSLPSRNTMLFVSSQEPGATAPLPSHGTHPTHVTHHDFLWNQREEDLSSPIYLGGHLLLSADSFSWLQISNGSPWVTLLISLFCSAKQNASI